MSGATSYGNAGGQEPSSGSADLRSSRVTVPGTQTARLRRIVTVDGADGRSRVEMDGGPSPILEHAPGDGLYEVWVEGGEAAAEAATLLPPAGGAVFRWFTVLPDTSGLTPAELTPFYDAAFRTLTPLDVRPDTSRHPGMHKTPTLDFIVVIQGSVRLILDEEERTLGPGDVVVQRGANHAWACAGDRPALLAAVLLDRRST